MVISSALALVDGITYKPGWHFSAEDHTGRFEGAIKIRIDYPARNTDRDQYPAYGEDIQPYADFVVTVGESDCDDTKLYRRIFERIMEIETHEAREFFRVAPTGWAPFHPHQIDGNRRWGIDLDRDLQFGVA